MQFRIHYECVEIIQRCVWRKLCYTLNIFLLIYYFHGMFLLSCNTQHILAHQNIWISRKKAPSVDKENFTWDLLSWMFGTEKSKAKKQEENILKKKKREKSSFSLFTFDRLTIHTHIHTQKFRQWILFYSCFCFLFFLRASTFYALCMY